MVTCCQHGRFIRFHQRGILFFLAMSNRGKRRRRSWASLLPVSSPSTGVPLRSSTVATSLLLIPSSHAGSNRDFLLYRFAVFFFFFCFVFAEFSSKRHCFPPFMVKEEGLQLVISEGKHNAKIIELWENGDAPMSSSVSRLFEVRALQLVY